MKKMKMYLSLSLLILLAVCCMASAASAEKKVSLHDDLPFVNGMTTISWDVNEASTTRYVVNYKVINNGTAVQSTMKAGRTYDNSVETAGIIPGKCYEITVSDIMGNVLDQKAYRMDDAETYTDGNLKNTSIKVYVKPSMMEYGKEPKQVSGLKVKDITKGLDELLKLSGTGTFYGVKYQMSLPRATKERSVFITLAFESPDGYLYVDKTTYVTVEKSSSNSWQNLSWKIAGENFFLNLYQENQSIPAGKYSTHLYWDGKWVNTSHFTVK